MPQLDLMTEAECAACDEAEVTAARSLFGSDATIKQISFSDLVRLDDVSSIWLGKQHAVYKLRVEIIDWCNDAIGYVPCMTRDITEQGHFIGARSYIMFHSDDDATLFSLRWL